MPPTVSFLPRHGRNSYTSSSRPSSRHNNPAPLVFIAVLLVALGFAASHVAHAQTLWVQPSTGSDTTACTTQGTPCRTIQYALNQAPTSGSEIRLLPGTYSGAGNTVLTFPGKTVNITGVGGSGSVFIDGQNTNQLFRFVANEAGWIDGVTLIRGRAASGACALYRNSTMVWVTTIRQGINPWTDQSKADGLFAEGGGALYILNSGPQFHNVTFQFNRANQAAASAWLDNGATPIFRDCTFQFERAESFGGSVVPEGTSDGRFYNCKWNGCFSKFGGSIDTGSTSTTEFHNVEIYNSTGQRGGAIYHYNADRVKIYNSRIYNNTAETNGGGIVFSINVMPLYVNCSFWDNIAGGVGGAVYAESNSNGTFIDTSFYRNRAPGGGGAIFARGSVIINSINNQVYNNTAIYGAGMLFEDQCVVNVNGLNCTHNTADLDGGCIKFQNNVNFRVTNSIISRNVANTEGGAMAMDSNSQLTMTNTVVEANSASSSRGGGLHVGGAASATLTGSTFRGNVASKGGAIDLVARGSLTVTGTTITGNTAPQGGGIYTGSVGGFTLNDTTFDANVADFGGAVFLDSNANAGNNVMNRGNIRNHRAKAGAAFFYNVWSRLLTYSNASTTFTNNSALYGDQEATKPYRMRETAPLLSGYSPKDRFALNLQLIDFFGNVAVETPDQVIVTIEGRNGLQVESSIVRQGFQRGEAKFESVIVYGMRGQTYTLTASSLSLPTLTFPITIISCGPGYESSQIGTDPTYRCTRCTPGTYSLVSDERCNPCPTGADCTKGGANITTLFGFWMDPASLELRDPKLYRCSGANCIGESKCGPFREDRLCSRCMQGYSEWNKECQDCTTSTSPGWLLAPLTAGIVYAALLIRFQRLTEAGIPKSLVFFIQASLILVANDNRGSAQSVLVTFNLAFDWIINLDYRNKCVLNLGPLGRLAYDFYAPSTPIIGVVICAIVMKLYHAIVLRQSMTSYWNWRIVAAFIWVLLWGYIMVAKATFNLLNCVQVGSQVVLAAAPSVICGNPEHVPYMAFAWIVVIFYIVGLPAACGGLLIYARKRLAVDPNYPLVKELYKAFQPSMWYYEIVLTLRKLLLTLLDVFLSTMEAEHALALCVFFYVIFVVQYATQPFKNRLFNRAEDFLLMTLILMSGLSMGNTMRTNYLSNLDVIGASYGFVIIGILVVLTFIVALTQTGARVLAKFISRHPALARSINNMTSIKEKVAAMGSQYSMGKGSKGNSAAGSPKGSVGGLNAETNVAAMTSAGKLATSASKSSGGGGQAASEMVKSGAMTTERGTEMGMGPVATGRDERPAASGSKGSLRRSRSGVAGEKPESG
ncbi:hypothetical protein BCR44DRAFT_127211 [Catenaria anguillulae PL171]|uniref:Right handed beta helix domain-containing protein n=1 Tax=Catenaria anguillulae PL171 TaxID=765915 RepID=A0A1Y2HP64_9FUNG|nr:hypothetical protein BCR44DRAFT_127211 [Catenaria anguillulae PL171]